MKTGWWLPLLAVVLGGCARNVYEIELDPAGKSLNRTLTVKQQSQSGSDAPTAFADEVTRIAREYRADEPAPGKSHVFRGRFAGRMPNDVGGYGTFTHWDTPLGAASVYIERFRGNDDVAGILKHRQATADRVIDLLVAWLEQELKGDPQWPVLRRFLHDDFRRDFQNLAIYAWTANLGHKTDDYTAAAVRALQYIVERGYVDPDKIPAISRAFTDAGRGEYTRLVAWSSELIAARIRSNVPQTPVHLATPEGLTKSLTAFLESTDEYASLEQEWQEELKLVPDTAQPDGMDVLGRLIAELCSGWLDYQGGGDQLSVALKTTRPALFTNGEWSADSGQITWSSQRLSHEGMPAVLYAAWDEPDEIGQKSRFGAIVLQRESLLEFCVWYRGLTTGERDEWDTFIDRLSPDSDHEEALSHFRFSHEPVDRKNDDRLAAASIAAILNGLKTSR